jgi:hypothetical protein
MKTLNKIFLNLNKKIKYLFNNFKKAGAAMVSNRVI